jgi:hypothetical protein
VCAQCGGGSFLAQDGRGVRGGKITLLTLMTLLILLSLFTIYSFLFIFSALLLLLQP